MFENRRAAGRFLAEKLKAYSQRDDVVILALPRGGVPVAFEIANVLEAPLDIFLVRKLGAPSHPELAIGAIASGGVRVLNDEIARKLRITPEEIEAVAEREAAELERRENSYRKEAPPLELRGKIVILVDDGLATGATMRAAAEAVRQFGPAKIVVAAPVGAPDSCAGFEAIADEVCCGIMPEDFGAVGRWYDDFAQTTDEEVCGLLERARGLGHPA